MITPQQLLAAIKTAKALEEFIRKGELADVISDVELASAKTALEKSKIANNPNAQVWSAINHLETAHQALLKSYKGKGTFYDMMATRFKMDIAAKKDRWVLTLMAICYKFLGELELCKSAIEETKHAHTEDEVAPVISYILTVPQILDPRVWMLNYAGDDIPYISEDDLKSMLAG